MRFPAKERWQSPPPVGRAALELSSPFHRVLTYVRMGWRTLKSESKFLASIGYQIFLPMVLPLRALRVRELRYELLHLQGPEQRNDAPPQKSCPN